MKLLEGRATEVSIAGYLARQGQISRTSVPRVGSVRGSHLPIQWNLRSRCASESAHKAQGALRKWRGVAYVVDMSIVKSVALVEIKALASPLLEEPAGAVLYTAPSISPTIELPAVFRPWS